MLEEFPACCETLYQNICFSGPQTQLCKPVCAHKQGHKQAVPLVQLSRESPAGGAGLGWAQPRWLQADQTAGRAAGMKNLLEEESADNFWSVVLSDLRNLVRRNC